MSIEIGMLVFPKVTHLDLTGPHEVLGRIPGARVSVVARTAEPCRSETGLVIVPNTTFADAPPFDLVFVPGGSGQIAAAADGETLPWLATAAKQARWMTSACTGALLLGMAGLLDGYRAATHWAFMDLLALTGAIPVAERVVVDRDRITGGGVTAGIDIALAIAAELAGPEAAERIALYIEYDPKPAFAGHPRDAKPALVDELRAAVAARFSERADQIERIRRSD
jgi:cyclohexyl-isocyanide hydratase